MASCFVSISGVARLLPGLLTVVIWLGALSPAAQAAPAMVAHTLVDFEAAGVSMQSNLTLGADGSLYGTAGGLSGTIQGTVFRITPAGNYSTVTRFYNHPDATAGAYPYGTLVLADDGNFYGTTNGGGGPDSLGTIFKVTPAGVVTTLVRFSGNGATNKGSNPSAGLTPVGNGVFYGTTSQGGAGNMGTLFKVTANGVLTTLVEFTGGDGLYPGSYPSEMTLGSDGVLYGVTAGGGAAEWGTAFKMTKAGAFTSLLEFTYFGPENKGAYPRGALTEGPDGRLYGTTSLNYLGSGTVFAMTKEGVLSTIVEFTGSTGPNLGSSPTGKLVFDTDGTIYGTTSTGGTGADLTGGGTIFKISAGVLATLVDFTAGGSPAAGLTKGADGNFYGTTARGSAGDLGAIFKMTSAGVLTYLFEPGKLTHSPSSGLLLGGDSNFYGTTSGGGASGWGTVRRPGLTRLALCNRTPRARFTGRTEGGIITHCRSTTPSIRSRAEASSAGWAPPLFINSWRAV